MVPGRSQKRTSTYSMFSSLASLKISSDVFSDTERSFARLSADCVPQLMHAVTFSASGRGSWADKPKNRATSLLIAATGQCTLLIKRDDARPWQRHGPRHSWGRHVPAISISGGLAGARREVRLEAAVGDPRLIRFLCLAAVRRPLDPVLVSDTFLRRPSVGAAPSR